MPRQGTRLMFEPLRGRLCFSQVIRHSRENLRLHDGRRRIHDFLLLDVFGSPDAVQARPARDQPDMWAGSQRASSGKKTSSPSKTNMRRWNGIVPRMTSDSLPFQMLWMTNRLMPIGGEICPSSMNRTRMIPNQIGSMP